MASTAGGEVKPELIKSEHNIGYYDPIVEEDTDDEEAIKVVEEIRARSHLDVEEKLHQSTDVNAKIEKVNVKDEDTDDEFTPTDFNRDSQLHSTRKRKGNYDGTRLGRPVRTRLYPYPTKSVTRRGAPRKYLRYLNEELSKDQLVSWKDERNEHETNIFMGEKSITVEDVRSFVYSFNYTFQWGFPRKHTSICCTLDDFCIDTALKAQKVYCHIPVHLDGDDGQPSHMVGLTVAFPKRKILIFDPKNGSDTHDVVRKVTNAVDNIPHPFTNNKFEVVKIANCLLYKEHVDSALYVSFFFECISRKVDLLTELKLGLSDKWSCVERRLSYFLFYVSVGRIRYSMEHET